MDDLKFLDPATFLFSDANVSFGIHANSMRRYELIGIAACAETETRQNLSALAIDNTDLVCVLIRNV